jgi:hypothetical protein
MLPEEGLNEYGIHSGCRSWYQTLDHGFRLMGNEMLVGISRIASTGLGPLLPGDSPQRAGWYWTLLINDMNSGLQRSPDCEAIGFYPK